MPILQPTNCECYSLKLPPLPPILSANAAPSSSKLPTDEYTRKKLGLECRTGAAISLTRSSVYVHGGLTLPLNLQEVNTLNLQKELILYFAKLKNEKGISFQNLDQWISSETFFLDLISRTWKRIETTVDPTSLEGIENNKNLYTANDNEEKEVEIASNENKTEETTEGTAKNYNNNTNKPSSYNITCPLKERLFHSICFSNSCLYMFGGLIVSPQNGYELIATNQLWKLDLKTFQWSLLSSNPTIARRFNHTMHVKNENSDERDTKLIILGGLNNMNEPISTIDAYNITQNCWQSDAVPNDPLDLLTNIDGDPINLSNDKNFSILIENNEAKIPAVTFYSPNCRNNIDIETSSKEKQQTFTSPITALPLVSQSKGMRMAYSSLQKKEMLIEPFNLKYPTGDNFGYNIILGGFHPDCQSINLGCYVFDIPSGKWTRVGLNCADCKIAKHRFWRIFVWKSHHKALMLGTKKDDQCLPSVQKFDHLLSFDLSMLNAFNKTVHPLQEVNEISNQNSISNSNLQNNLNEIFKQKLVLESDDRNINDHESRKFDNSNTSQFEKYISYVAPPIELNNVRSVFPPYAMVLGKDSLEIFGKILSDFEFITAEGDSIGVPFYLLRKRWGRYFDLLISRAYTSAVADYEQTGTASCLVRSASPRNSRSGSRDFLRERQRSSLGSFSHNFPKHLGSVSFMPSYNFSQSNESTNLINESHSQQNNSIAETNSGINSPTLHETPSPPPLEANNPFRDSHNNSKISFKVDDIDDSIAPHTLPTSKENSTTIFNQCNNISPTVPKKSTTNCSTTSSSGGLVFRVPFQENGYSTIKVSPSKDINLDNQEKRRSSALDVVTDNNNLNGNNSLSTWKTDFRKRRASHPAVFSVKRNDMLSPPQSRHGSIRPPTSSRSSISYVSSSSERKENAIISRCRSKDSSRRSSITDSSFNSIMNVILPQQPLLPNDPLPVPRLSRSSGSLHDYSFSNKASPLSSRRASHVSATLTKDVSTPPEFSGNTLDGQLLETTGFSFAQRQASVPSGDFSSRNSNDISYDSMRKSVTSGERPRLSITSNTDSIDSHGSTFPIELEPLLIPRSLYMPWSTITVRAFSEFFYTGQVSGKWLLAPVVLDLLILGKIYEIPLLYSLVSDVIYSLVGRKEESLYVICNSLRSSLKDKVIDHFEGKRESVDSYLESSEDFQTLLKIKGSLEIIDDGFLEIGLLSKMSRNHSTSTHGSSSGGEGLDPLSSLKNGTFGSFSHYHSTVYSGGPRDSYVSVGSLGVPGGYNFEQKRVNSAYSQYSKKKSSLSKEIDPNYFKEDYKFEPPVKKDIRRSSDVKAAVFSENSHACNHIGVRMSDIDSITTDDSTTTTTSSGSDESGKSDSDEDDITNARILDTRNTEENDGSDNEDEDDNKAMERLLGTKEKERGSRDSISTSLDADLGLLSLKKMRKMIKKGEEYFEESIDPLVRINTALQSPTHLQRSQSRSGTGGGGSFSLGKQVKDHASAKDYENITLENMISPDALPPVDYVIKSIYRSSVMVNDSRLMVRCLDCLELSKSLKAIGKRINALDLSKTAYER